MNYDSVIGFADSILSKKDPYNHHGSNVAEMCLKIGLAYGMDKEHLEFLSHSARLHDVGKILLDDVLLNYPRRLTSGEYARMQSHAKLGYELLENLDCNEEVREAIYCHHEHYDGSGYPRGLSGENIPIFARIICVADVWDSMTNDRAYKKATSSEDALKEMEKCKSWFDPRLYKIFLDVTHARSE